jgi:stearoyl-CoA desaturase (delta-9 desaturase)
MRIAIRPATSSHQGTEMTATADLSVAPDDTSLAPADLGEPTEPTELAEPTEVAAPAGRRTPLAEIDPEPRTNFARVMIATFTGVPMLALIAAVPVAWIWGLLDWQAIVIGVGFYVFTGLGIAMGFHRYFTHGSFKANRGVKIALAVAGSMAIEGPILDWVSDHRRHHKYSDKEGDPHSPWRFGNDVKALAKGLIWAHMGWLFDRDVTSHQKFSPDWLADRDIRRINTLFPALVAVTLLAPAALGGLLTWSWQGALIAFFWASLVRVSFLHHVTWSINSICHTFGKREFEARDESKNVAWLAVLSFGESWHNLHHADPTCARHGVFKGQVDIAARGIWLAEKLGWVWQVRWPDETRLTGKKVGSARELGPMTRRSAAAA